MDSQRAAAAACEAALGLVNVAQLLRHGSQSGSDNQLAALPEVLAARLQSQGFSAQKAGSFAHGLSKLLDDFVSPNSSDSTVTQANSLWGAPVGGTPGPFSSSLAPFGQVPSLASTQFGNPFGSSGISQSSDALTMSGDSAMGSLSANMLSFSPFGSALSLGSAAQVLPMDGQAARSSLGALGLGLESELDSVPAAVAGLWDEQPGSGESGTHAPSVGASSLSDSSLVQGPGTSGPSTGSMLTLLPLFSASAPEFTPVMASSTLSSAASPSSFDTAGGFGPSAPRPAGAGAAAGAHAGPRLPSTAEAGSTAARAPPSAPQSAGAPASGSTTFAQRAAAAAGPSSGPSGAATQASSPVAPQQVSAKDKDKEQSKGPGWAAVAAKGTPSKKAAASGAATGAGASAAAAVSSGASAPAHATTSAQSALSSSPTSERRTSTVSTLSSDNSSGGAPAGNAHASVVAAAAVTSTSAARPGPAAVASVSSANSSSKGAQGVASSTAPLTPAKTSKAGTKAAAAEPRTPASTAVHVQGAGVAGSSGPREDGQGWTVVKGGTGTATTGTSTAAAPAPVVAPAAKPAAAAAGSVKPAAAAVMEPTPTPSASQSADKATADKDSASKILAAATASVAAASTSAASADAGPSSAPAAQPSGAGSAKATGKPGAKSKAAGGKNAAGASSSSTAAAKSSSSSNQSSSSDTIDESDLDLMTIAVALDALVKKGEDGAWVPCHVLTDEAYGASGNSRAQLMPGHEGPEFMPNLAAFESFFQSWDELRNRVVAYHSARPATATAALARLGLTVRELETGGGSDVMVFDTAEAGQVAATKASTETASGTSAAGPGKVERQPAVYGRSLASCLWLALPPALQNRLAAHASIATSKGDGKGDGSTPSEISNTTSGNANTISAGQLGSMLFSREDGLSKQLLRAVQKANFGIIIDALGVLTKGCAAAKMDGGAWEKLAYKNTFTYTGLVVMENTLRGVLQPWLRLFETFRELDGVKLVRLGLQPLLKETVSVFLRAMPDSDFGPLKRLACGETLPASTGWPSLPHTVIRGCMTPLTSKYTYKWLPASLTASDGQAFQLNCHVQEPRMSSSCPTQVCFYWKRTRATPASANGSASGAGSSATGNSAGGVNETAAAAPGTEVDLAATTTAAAAHVAQANSALSSALAAASKGNVTDVCAGINHASNAIATLKSMLAEAGDQKLSEKADKMDKGLAAALAAAKAAKGAQAGLSQAGLSQAGVVDDGGSEPQFVPPFPSGPSDPPITLQAYAQYTERRRPGLTVSGLSSTPQTSPWYCTFDEGLSPDQAGNKQAVLRIGGPVASDPALAELIQSFTAVTGQPQDELIKVSGLGNSPRFGGRYKINGVCHAQTGQVWAYVLPAGGPGAAGTATGAAADAAGQIVPHSGRDKGSTAHGQSKATSPASPGSTAAHAAVSVAEAEASAASACKLVHAMWAASMEMTARKTEEYDSYVQILPRQLSMYERCGPEEVHALGASVLHKINFEYVLQEHLARTGDSVQRLGSANYMPGRDPQGATAAVQSVLDSWNLEAGHLFHMLPGPLTKEVGSVVDDIRRYFWLTFAGSLPKEWSQPLRILGPALVNRARTACGDGPLEAYCMDKWDDRPYLRFMRHLIQAAVEIDLHIQGLIKGIHTAEEKLEAIIAEKEARVPLGQDVPLEYSRSVTLEAVLIRAAVLNAAGRAPGDRHGGAESAAATDDPALAPAEPQDTVLFILRTIVDMVLPADLAGAAPEHVAALWDAAVAAAPEVNSREMLEFLPIFCTFDFCEGGNTGADAAGSGPESGPSGPTAPRDFKEVALKLRRSLQDEQWLVLTGRRE